ncbi:MAG: hypothetical protein KDA05_07470, partial [Phycisphaerales bacterium]|nr:hypothetical protein [Phycisphaerales bacterium]
MKSFLDWAKSNLVVSIILVVAIIGIPVMIFFSGRWNTGVRKAAADEASAQAREISNVSSTTYTIPAIIPGQAEVSVSTAPNAATTERVRTLRRELTETTESVKGEAITWNQRDKAAMLTTGAPEDRLFPAPANESARLRLTKRMIQMWPEAHKALMERFHVGQPPDPTALAADLQRLRQRERSAIVEGRIDQNLTAEESETINQTLQRARTQRYHDTAARFTVYGSMAMFKAVKPLGEAEVPPVETLWDWQQILWIHSDILEAVLAANSSGGAAGGTA